MSHEHCQQLGWALVQQDWGLRQVDDAGRALPGRLASTWARIARRASQVLRCGERPSAGTES